ncbi:CsgG/HfaB family protein [Desulfopila sp. IMCC35008]|uniref:CsgG/HfaB family protein n=1 Tax=Desulfopila sp. IMCC35008 TaxID=2653858 RepID=UPI0013D0703F|nr:CsgG/HfaB family protein [Desulfopila sp. IMCC35008]
MKRKPFFKFLCMVTILFYSSATVMAGQVITNSERDWAKKAIKQEADLGLLDSTNSIAVLNYRNLTGIKQFNGLQKGLALMLITDLSKVDNLFVVERIKMQALLDEMDLGISGIVTPETAPAVGKLLKAAYVTTGDIGEGGLDQLQLTPSLLDVPFEKQSTLPVAAGDIDNIVQLEKEIVFNITDKLSIFIPEEKRKEILVPLSLSTAALLALFLAVDYSDKGMYEKAAELYSEALAEDPGLELARESLVELQDMGLIARQDLPVVEETVPAPTEGGSSMGTIIGVGLGIAAIAGVAAIAGGSSSSSDDGGSTDQNTDTPSDSSLPTVSTSDENLKCYDDYVTFNFSESMNTNANYQVVPDQSVELSANWQTDSRLLVSPGDSTLCDTKGPDTLTLQLSGFSSLEGEALSGQTSFTFGITK